MIVPNHKIAEDGEVRKEYEEELKKVFFTFIHVVYDISKRKESCNFS